MYRLFKIIVVATMLAATPVLPAASAAEEPPTIEVELLSIPTPGRVYLEVRGSGFTPGVVQGAVTCTAPGGEVAQITRPRDCSLRPLRNTEVDAQGDFEVRLNVPFDEHLAIAVRNFEQTEGALALVPFPADHCRGRAATIVGTDQDDDLVGTPGADVILSLAGDDTIRGLSGDDVVCSGPGDDRVFAGDGDDWVFGEEGIDKVRGGAGADGLFGGADMDFLLGGADEDFIDGERGPDRLRGGVGDDRILGRKGADVLWGGPGNDHLTGGLSHDILKGGDGLDRCFDRNRLVTDVFIQCQ